MERYKIGEDRGEKDEKTGQFTTPFHIKNLLLPFPPHTILDEFKVK
jgi:hypothetical protein